MPRYRKTVTWTKPDPSRLPDWSAPGVALLADLERRGMLESLTEQVQIRRQGGFIGIDVLLFLLLFFSSRCGMGRKAFWADLRPHQQQLAALAGRQCLPSSTSVSRALDAACSETLRPLYPWLLVEVAGALDVLRHPSVVTRDARGEAWHLFDYDGTRHVLRHRALPEGTDLPPPERRSEPIAAPGYTGRKRGDVQIHRATLQHAGTGLWLFAALAPGNGEKRRDLDAALGTVVRTCHALGHPLERALIRMDGEFGWVPDFTACRVHGVPFVTRLNRPDLLDQPDVRQRLLAAAWVRVTDAGGGPRRSAIDLGQVTVFPGETTLRDDGTPYEPVTVRVIVSRFEQAQAQRGRVIEGWQYELFAFDADPVAWPAADGIAAYFGRTAQENRFHQEDQELCLDRIFSYTLAGQEFATLIGLMTWNLQIARGFELAPPPTALPMQSPSAPEIDARPVPAATAVTGAPEAEPVRVPSERPAVFDPEGTRGQLNEALDQLDWATLLVYRPGWHWRWGRGELSCPDGQGLALSSVESPPRTRIFFSGRSGVCDDCRYRPACFASTASRARKMTSVTLEGDVAARLRALWGQVARRPPTASVPTPSPSPQPPANRRGDLPLQRLSDEPPGPYAIAVSLFLPAAARHAFAHAARNLTTHVEVDLPRPRRQPRLIAATVGARQHRRLSWTERVARNALPDEAQVRVTYAGAGRLALLLDDERAQARAVA
jgi:hypothetical protein